MATTIQKLRPKSKLNILKDSNYEYCNDQTETKKVEKSKPKELKVLEYRPCSVSQYPATNGYFALALIDRKEGYAETRVSKDEKLQNRYYGKVFFKCREEFGNVFLADCKSIAYVHNAAFTPVIRDFMSQVEDKLNISAKEKSLFFETSNEKISAIRVSPFWLNCPMRRQAFTLFLRAGLNHKLEVDIQEAINQYPFSKGILPFFELFLEGYSVFGEKTVKKLEADMHHGVVFNFKNVLREHIIEGKLLLKEN